MRSLLIQVHLLNPLWHGSGDWPPSPFRLFQAMVAGAFGGRWAGEEHNAREQRSHAFEWLQRQHAPLIAAPPRFKCRSFTSYVPNNDIDSVGGDPRRVEKIRAEKVISPIRLEQSQTFHYAWHFETGEAEAKLICRFVERLHTFGRGVDPAWARAEVVDHEVAEAILEAHGAVAHPSGSKGGRLLPCPAEGSLESLVLRHRAVTGRLGRDPASRKILFRQPPKAHYRQVGYDRSPTRLLLEIRRQDDPGRFAPIPQVKALALTEAVREEATRRLSNASDAYAPLAERFVAGREAGAADRDRRVRIVPLATIGHPDASLSIRRVVVEIPPECPLSVGDVQWAFIGMQLADEGRPEALSASPIILVPAQSDDMLGHYGYDEAFQRWRSVTPVALPRPPAGSRSGAERSRSEAQCASAFVNALRHAGFTEPVAEIRIQREPFLPRGEFADAFESPRFVGRLRHVEVTFRSAVRGPLILGDGRFLGLGVMHPVKQSPPGLHIFAVDQHSALALSNSAAVARALRRALMVRAQALYERGALPVLFHGHRDDGSPNRSGSHQHLFFAAYSSDGGERIDRVAAIAPRLCDRSIQHRKNENELAEAVVGLQELRCGRLGVLTLNPTTWDAGDRCFGKGRVWASAIPYTVTRHAKRGQSLLSVIEIDIRTECSRRGLPTPESVHVLRTAEGPRGGLRAEVRIEFATAVQGPVLLGRGSHVGEGLFRLV